MPTIVNAPHRFSLRCASSMLRVSLVAVALLSCSAPAQIRDLRAAESYEAARQYKHALQAYRAAQQSCRDVSSKRRRREACAAAYLQYAELLVDMGQTQDAIEAYHTTETVLAGDARASARACFASALLYEQLGDDQAHYKYLWRTITNYPNQESAADASKRLLHSGRKRSPEQLREAFKGLVVPLADTKIADNLLEALAELEEVEFQSPKTALHYYDLLVEGHPTSGFYDDALWHGARLSRSLGDPAGAVRRLRQLLRTRVVALGAGSYFSVWLDNAQLELGIVLRDDLQDYNGAIKAFATLPSDYPASILRDDALFERAVAKAKAGHKDNACKDLTKLKTKYKDSKYELQEAPALRASLGCH